MLNFVKNFANFAEIPNFAAITRENKTSNKEEKEKKEIKIKINILKLKLSLTLTLILKI